MPQVRYIDQDSVKVRDDKGKLITTLFWGDPVTVVRTEDGQHEIEIERRNRETEEWESHRGFFPAGIRLQDTSTVLKVRFVDVGQGDGAIVETPAGRLLLIDGGEGDNFARYAFFVFRRWLKEGPVPFEAVVATHGDADHFAGLTELLSRKKGGKPRFVPKAVFHNGLVKRSTKKADGTNREDVELFGETTVAGDGATYCTELVDDLVDVDPEEMNTPFRNWQQALQDLRKANRKMKIRRLSYGDDKVFESFGDEGIKVKILGPIVDEVGGKPALRFLKKPGSRTRLSASHTVNGHSIVLKLTYGNVRFLFGADLNEESEERLLEQAHKDGLSLAAEVLKVPHHGSHEFNPRVLEAIRPVVSVVSSGDETALKEYIHPRSGLVGALGKYSRASVERPLVFVTEMVAFFAQAKELFRKRKKSEIGPGESPYEEVPNAYVKSQYGIVHVRTDGRRVLVFTHSGRESMKEKYAFQVDEHGEIAFED
jgi:beta-lactamase superfamily II metal-dependent hydrolase